MSALYRPAPFWSWNDKINKEELSRQIEEMAEIDGKQYSICKRVYSLGNLWFNKASYGDIAYDIVTNNNYPC
jgi:hypothetical protein